MSGPLTFGSLFSGIGGMDLGFERVGFRCVFQVEINPFCQRVLAKHWPDVRRHDDIRTFAPEGQEWACDAIIGGFPCKQTSTAAAVHGRRAGLAGRDSGLWFEMLRVVRLVRPRWVVVENVAGAGSYADEIEGGLADAGYRLPIGPLRLSAASAGAPHRRERLFWVAHRHESGLPLPRLAWALQAERRAGGAPDGNPWVSALPGSVRVADGLPSGLHRRERIVALGNAVVPQVAEQVARLVLSLDN